MVIDTGPKNTTKEDALPSKGRSTLKKRLTEPTLLEMSGNPGGLNRSMQHHLKDLLFKDGVYDPEETVETFCHARRPIYGSDGRPGSRCMRLGAPLTSHIPPFAICCCLAEGFLPQCAAAPV